MAGRGYIGTKPPSSEEFFIPENKRFWWRRMKFKVRRNATDAELAAASMAFGKGTQVRRLNDILKEVAALDAATDPDAPEASPELDASKKKASKKKASKKKAEA